MSEPIKKDPYNRIYFYAFLLVFMALGIYIVLPYLDLIFSSIFIVTLFHPVYNFFRKRARMPEIIATLLSVILVIVVFVIPFSFIVNVTIKQIGTFYTDINQFLTGSSGLSDPIKLLIEQINKLLSSFPIISFRVTEEWLRAQLSSILSPVLGFVINRSIDIGSGIIGMIPVLVVLLFILWSAFPGYDRFIELIKRLSPLTEDLDNLYLTRVTAMVRGMVKGTFTISFIQGCVGGIALALLGVPYAFFWTLLMIFLSIVPLGAGLITVPTGLILISIGRVWEGIAILLVQFIVISNVDNVLRPLLVPKEAELHPIVLLLGILGGVRVFGFLGIIYGPLIMVILVTSLEIYQRYYKIQTLHEVKPEKIAVKLPEKSKRLSRQ